MSVSTPTDAAAWADKHIIPQLRDIIDNGRLNPVYASVSDWLWDFWPDFPWDLHGRMLVVHALYFDDERHNVLRCFDSKMQTSGTSVSLIAQLCCAMRDPNCEEEW